MEQAARRRPGARARPTSRRSSRGRRAGRAAWTRCRDCLGRLHQRAASLELASPPDTHEALDRLRAAGLRLGVVSNSDGRVEEALRAAGLATVFRRGARLGAGRRGEARSRYLPCRARRARRRPGGGAVRGRPLRGGRGRRPSGRDRRPSCSCPDWRRARDRSVARVDSLGALADDLLTRRDAPDDGATRPRCPARSACWSPSPDSTGTIAAPRWWPPRCATPGWKWSTPGCTRRPR